MCTNLIRMNNISAKIKKLENELLYIRDNIEKLKDDLKNQTSLETRLEADIASGKNMLLDLEQEYANECGKFNNE